MEIEGLLGVSQAVRGIGGIRGVGDVMGVLGASREVGMQGSEWV